MTGTASNTDAWKRHHPEPVEGDALAAAVAALADEEWVRNAGWLRQRLRALLSDPAAALARHDAQVAAQALREAAREFAEGEWSEAWGTDGVCDDVSAVQSTERWLNRRADRIEREGGTSE